MQEEAGSALDRAPLEGFKDFYQYASPTRVIAGRDLPSRPASSSSRREHTASSS